MFAGMPWVPRRRVLDPRTIPDLEWFLDISDPTTLFSDSGMTTFASVGGAVGYVKDKSGNAYDLIQSASASARGTLTAGQHNGKPGLVFDAGDYYETTQGVPTGSPFTAIWIGKVPDTGLPKTIISGASGSSDIRFSDAEKIELVRDSVLDIGTATNAASATATSLQIVTYDGTTVSFFADGVANGSAAPDSTGTTGNTTHFGRYASAGLQFLASNMGAWLFYSRVLTSAEMTKIREQYARPHWGTP
jgi:hypothetical protein